jgi:hypothetical protein
VLAPAEVLIDLLRQLADVPDRAKSRYLLALMLLRRRMVKLAKAGQRESSETAEQDWLRVEVPGDAAVIEVAVCRIGRGEADRLRDELNELLYCEAEPTL